MTLAESARISVPAGPGPHPVLCFLHGYDEAATRAGAGGLSRHGPLRPGNPASIAARFLIVVPQLPLAGDIWHRYADHVRDMVESALERHGGDPDRRYLTGFSFGGNGVFDLALLQPDFWAALWAVDPTRVPARDPQRPVWLSVGEVARHRKERYISRLGLEPAGRSPGQRVYLDEGDDHVGSARRAYADERIYGWLLGAALTARSLHE